MFVELETYCQMHGDCNVQQHWAENPQLGIWVSQQRYRKALGKLDAERTRRLEATGFDWNPIATAWEKMFAELTAYKKVHGDCHVPDSWPKNMQLARWVSKQRTVKRKGELEAERIARLEALGFDWNPAATAWEKMFAELIAYKQEHGGCNVPRHWAANPKLGSWVHNQRVKKKQNKVSIARFAKLNKLGFEWERQIS
jgi:hypothetical protein